MNHILLADPKGFVMNEIREWTKDQVLQIVLGSLDAIRDILVDLSYSVTLVGSGVLILFWIVGWQGAKKWVGVLLLSFVLIKFLLGG
jgi:hypothetical protein